ncbi:TlpA family protein disulfide reductase [Flavobacterium sp.]
MKNILTMILGAAMFFSCASPQKSEFSKQSLTKMVLTTNKSEVSFSEILQKQKGKTTVIEVWASWCSDCIKAMPKVKKMQEDHPEVSYVFISMDKEYDKWINGIEKHDLQGIHYWATEGMKGEFAKSIDVNWIPRYIVLDKEGTIKIYNAIETDFDKINASLKELE